MGLPAEILVVIGGFLHRYDRRALGMAHPLYEKGREKRSIDRSRFLCSVAGYEELVRWGCPVDESMLHAACLAGCLDVVRLIKNTGMAWGHGKAGAAIISGNMELLDWMLSSGANIHDHKYTTVRHVCVEALEIIRSHGIDMNPSPSAIRNAALWGHAAVLEWYAERGFNISWTNVLHSAACGDREDGELSYVKRQCPRRGLSHVEMVRWALSRATPNEDTLLCAISSGNVEVFDLVHGSGELEFSHLDAADRAIKSGSIDMVKRISRVIRNMPRLLAESRHHLYPPTVPIAEWCLRNRLRLGEHAMMRAARSGNLELVQWLHSNGCPHDDRTTIHALRSKNPIKVFSWMIDNGFEFDVGYIEELEGGTRSEVHKWLIKKYGHLIDDISDEE